MGGCAFHHPLLVNRSYPRVVKPHGKSKKVKKPYVDKCLDALDMLEQFQEEGKE